MSVDISKPIKKSGFDIMRASSIIKISLIFLFMFYYKPEFAYISHLRETSLTTLLLTPEVGFLFGYSKHKIKEQIFCLKLMIFIYCGLLIFYCDYLFNNTMALLSFSLLAMLEVARYLYCKAFLYNKKPTKVSVSICILVSVSLLLYFCYTFQYAVDMGAKKNQQWYLENTGDVKAILKADEYDYVSVPLEGIDIDGEMMLGRIKAYYSVGLPGKKKESIVAVIGTGIDYHHQDLRKSMWVNRGEVDRDGIDNDGNGYVDDIYGYNLCDASGDISAYDISEFENSQGTASAGIIAGKGRMTGVSGGNKVKIMSLKVLDSQDQSNTPDIQRNTPDDRGNMGDVGRIIEAIKYAENNGAKVCNINVSIPEYSQELEEVMGGSNMLFVVPAGDGDTEGNGTNIDQIPQYPASYDLSNMIVVANLSYDGKLNRTSNYGLQSVDVAAPGNCIYSTNVDNGYGYFYGTSMAAAVVSGIAGLEYLVSEEMEVSLAKDIIMASTVKREDLTEEVAMGGMVNGAEAVILAMRLGNPPPEWMRYTRD